MSPCPHPEKTARRGFREAMKARDSLEAEKGIDLGLRHLGHKHKTPPWYGRRRKGKR